MRLTSVNDLYIVHHLEVAFYGISQPGHWIFIKVRSGAMMLGSTELKTAMCIAEPPVDTVIIHPHYTRMTLSHHIPHGSIDRFAAHDSGCVPRHRPCFAVTAFRGLRDRYPVL